MTELRCLLFTACFILSIASSTSHDTYFKQENELQGHLCRDAIRDKPVEVKSRLHCAARCHRDAICVSFFYSHVTRKCQTHRRFLTTSSTCSTDVTFKYYVCKGRNGLLVYPNRPGYMYDIGADLCYRVNDFPLKTWLEARVLCQLEGGDLIKINTPVKLRIVQDIVLKDGSHEYFVGARRYEGESFQWVIDNSTAVGFDGWGKVGSCMEMDAAPTLAFDTCNCSRAEQKFFCEIQLP